MMIHRRQKQSSPRTCDRRGTTLMLFLVLLPLLIVLLGFSIDFAHMEACRGELRRSADLSAKAAAASLADNDESFARNVARQVAAENPVAGQPLLLNSEHIIFGRSNLNPDGSVGFTADATPFNAVRVIGDRTVDSPSGPINKYFGSLYSSPVFTPRVGATAALVDTEISLVLDRSSSMKLQVSDPALGMAATDPRFCQVPEPGCRWLALQNAVAVLLDRIDTTAMDEQVGIVTFASDDNACGIASEAATIDQSLTSNSSLVRQALADRSTSVWGGGTDIASGIQQSQQMLTGPNGRGAAKKIMIVITDGQYTEADPIPYAEIAHANGITIHTVTFGEGANQDDMIAVATAGEGLHFHALSTADLVHIFDSLGTSASQLIQ